MTSAATTIDSEGFDAPGAPARAARSATRPRRARGAPVTGAIDREAPVPMYRQLGARIIETIEQRGLGPGDLLPGEHRLCEEFGVSRTVVRQALAQLEHQGVIERVKGKGTFVAHQKTPESLVHTLAGLYEEVAARGGHVHSEVRRQEFEPADEDIAAQLRVPVGARVLVIERLRFVDGEPWSLSTTWLPEAIGVHAESADLRDRSLYGLLAEHGIRAVEGVRSAEATIADETHGRLLKVGVGQPLLVLRSVSMDEDGRPIEVFVAYHRGDRSRFEFQLRASAGDVSTAELRHTGL
ncbi:GntR family transcriptional regulator [Labedella phragmitis]|uniref:GntR family transcriptional regulator n=1 Tax=Labedella phragmitis TaxID=2498849 RepID=A0A444PYR1_9MICO|nr:GntR family transcriptional regulator [Labedella phragmitis]RWZ53024.1 GntR family transcriptional regulator [Labedella phragmitis]